MPTERRYLPAESLRWLGLALAVGLVVISLDLISKRLITSELGREGTRSTIQIVGEFIELHYGRNTGVAFGLFSGSSTIAGILVGIAIVPLSLVLFFLAGRGPWWAVAAGLVLGGAAGNLIDRMGDKSVTDFISVGPWPSFNLADSAITVGALLLIGLSFRDRDQTNDAADLR
jgi:signal peptidase II